MFIAAVTGTNGKTSVVEYCRQLLDAAGVPSGSLGSLGFVSRATGRQRHPLLGETPADLRSFVDRLEDEVGIRALALEAFSPALDGGIYAELEVAVGGFTNLTPEHLLGHGSMEAYEAAKARLYGDVVQDDGTAVVDVGSDVGERMADRARDRGLRVLTVGAPDARLRIVERRRQEQQAELLVAMDDERHQCTVPMFAPFEHANLLVAVGMCTAHPGTDLPGLLAAAADLRPPPGRMTAVGRVRGAVAVVDYAHNPGGLRAALEALQEETPGRLVVVFGAGGERDPQKREPMGRIAAVLADRVVVTDDNPRGEDPAAIRAAILRGCPTADEVADRGDAIRHAVSMLRSGDTLLVAGKGEEDHIEVAGRREEFSDIDVVAGAVHSAGGEVWV